MMLDPDTLVLLQVADAFESMRDHQLAMAEAEYEEEDTPGPSPRLWSSSSAYASFPYASTPLIIEACWQYQALAPDRLQPALPDGPCQCGLQYANAYIRLNKACRILYTYSAPVDASESRWTCNAQIKILLAQSSMTA